MIGLASCQVQSWCWLSSLESFSLLALDFHEKNLAARPQKSIKCAAFPLSYTSLTLSFLVNFFKDDDWRNRQRTLHKGRNLEWCDAQVKASLLSWSTLDRSRQHLRTWDIRYLPSPAFPGGIPIISSYRLCRTPVFPLCAAPLPPYQAEAGKTKLLHSTGPVLIPSVLISSRGNSLPLCTTQFTDPSVQLSKQNWEETPHLF